MVENGEPEVTLAEEDHHGLDGGYQDVDAVIKLLVIDGPEVRDLEACPQRSHVSTLCACSPVLLYAHTHARARARTHTQRAAARLPGDRGLAWTHVFFVCRDCLDFVTAQKRNVAARRSLDCFHEPERV